ncbi:MAG: COP23 domain-containing protein [Cyanobacteria bacterium P01_H01_bin.35]
MRLNRNVVAVAGVGVGVGVASLIISGISLLVDIGSLGINAFQSRSPYLVKKTDRFSCELQPDAEKDVWTVMYDDNKVKQPWLGIVKSMGEDWHPAERCGEIERRLENYRKDGLFSLEYRQDPNTPKQQVICAKTKLSGDGCPLLLTLDVGVDGYEALREMTEALRSSKTFDQNSEGKLANYNFSEESPVIYLQPFLAKEDRLAGK